VIVSEHAWWLASRAAGITALAAMTASVILGLVLANGLAGRRVRGAAIAVHEHLSLVALVAIAVHGEALLGDAFLDPSVGDLLVPGLIDYRPLAVAAGIAGGYLAAIVGLSFYARRRIGAHRWRALHRFSALAWVLSVAHTVTAGSDTGAAWLRIPLFASVGIVAALLTARLRGTRSGSRTSSTPRSSASARSPAR
jgi:methionine sulfoxide reductase heme-binding subunit